MGAEVAVTARRAITTGTPGVSAQVADKCHNDSIRRRRPQNTAEETDGQTETPDESMRARRRKPTLHCPPQPPWEPVTVTGHGRHVASLYWTTQPSTCSEPAQ